MEGDSGSIESWRVFRGRPISLAKLPADMDAWRVGRGCEPPGKRDSARPESGAGNMLPTAREPGPVERLGVRTPRGFLLNESRMPPLTSPLTVLPYNSFRAFEACGTSSNYSIFVSWRSGRINPKLTSTKHIGPLVFCLKQSLRYPTQRENKLRRLSSRWFG